METPAKGAVVLVRFPFSDLSPTKLRPAAVLADVGSGDRAAAETPLNRRFLSRLKQVEKLSPHQKKLLLGTSDAFLSKVSWAGTRDAWIVGSCTATGRCW